MLIPPEVLVPIKDALKNVLAWCKKHPKWALIISLLLVIPALAYLWMRARAKAYNAEQRVMVGEKRLAIDLEFNKALREAEDTSEEKLRELHEDREKKLAKVVEREKEIEKAAEGDDLDAVVDMLNERSWDF